MSKPIHRRDFLKGAAAGVGFWVAAQYVRGDEGAESPSPNERLNIAFVGTANRAGDNINDIVATNMANIVALCDVDDRFLGAAAARFPKAKTYNDYRKMLERKDIDCVLTATADHVHAWATLAALRSGRHAYCEKPLTHSVEECRLVTETAIREKRVTQMGTQIHAGENYRRVVELVQANAIGSVNEVHVFIDKTWFPDKPARTGVPVPPSLHWDLWLGPVPERPFSPDYLPATWRRWWAFGEGTLGDMGCHYQDLAFWALGLTSPTKIEAEGPPVDAEGCPEWLTVHYDYPARGEQPAVKLTWYDGPHNPPPVLRT
jgi:predicted dehydrogenase